MDWIKEDVERIAEMFEISEDEVMDLNNFSLDLTIDEMDQLSEQIRDLEYDLDDNGEMVTINFDNPSSFLAATDAYDEFYGYEPSDNISFDEY